MEEFDVDFLGQMVDSMADAVDKLEEAKGKRDDVTVHKMAEFILKIQSKIKEKCYDK